MSAITIQKIRNDKGLGTRHERWLALEQKNAEQALELSAEQAAFLEKLNPCSKLLKQLGGGTVIGPPLQGLQAGVDPADERLALGGDQPRRARGP
jgi:hypothetical protein